MRTLYFALAVIAPNVAIAGEQLEFPQPERAKFHLAKGGSGSVELTCLWKRSLYTKAKNQPEFLDLLADYGIENRKVTVSEVDDAHVRVITRGELANIFEFIRVVDSSKPYRLRQGYSLDLKWDGDVLFLRMRDPKQAVPPATSNVVCEITTDGRFTSRSVGEISEDRSKIVVSDNLQEFVIEVEGLADK